MTGSLVVHASGAARREAALAALRSESGRRIVVGARIEGARALAADLALAVGVALDVESATLDGLAAKLARPALVEAGQSIASTLAVDTAAARAVHALARSLPRMGPLRATPGLPRALGRTIEELWAADLAAGNVAPFDAELAAVLAHVERSLAAEGLVPRARVFEMALRAVREGALSRASVVLLDVPLRTRLAGELARAIASGAERALLTVPSADARTLGQLTGIPIASEVGAASGTAALADALFTSARSAVDPALLETIVARNEAAESAEIARRVLAAARAHTPLHRIAIVLRAPELGRASLEAAFRAAEIPLAQRRGARRPDPSGRALLALLACANEGLSARAFSAYLSFGVLPHTDTGAPPPASHNASARAYDDEEEDEHDEAALETVHAPRRWERLIVDAAVIGGDPERWRRRFSGLRAQLERSADELDRLGRESQGVRRTAGELASLERFALPLLDDLAALAPHATLAAHAEQIAAIATRALSHPARVLAVLAELAPRGPVGEEIALSDVARLLAPRLGAIEARPDARGVALVTPDELRGASFDVVIVAGLAERVFPARIAEDPLLPDAARRGLSPDLEDGHARAQNERLLLALAVGAAEQRVIALASIAGADGRPRVPSVYFVELLGRTLGRVAAGADVASAMDAAVSVVGSRDEAARASERTLARTRALTALPRDEARGRANHVVERNPLLKSALRRAWRLGEKKLTRSDGLVQSDKDARAPLLANDPSRRAYSATALESFAKCPLQFHLKAVMRLEPREEPAPLEELDALVRGSITHEAQFLTLLALREAGAIPLSPDRVGDALATFERVFAALRTELVDRLVPAIPRVFHGALDEIAADLREWLSRLASDPSWEPRYFELAFGLPGDDGRDPASRAEPAVLDEGITLRGAIDLVEAHAERGSLRATDFKSGSNYAIRGGGALVIRGGQTLQPVLYALALTKLFAGTTVEGGRLWYCSSKGRFEERTVPLDAPAREAARALATAVSDALAKGMLPAAPIDDRTCEFCDFALACGPHALSRADRVPAEELAARAPGLVALRRRA